jgi:hypothetical protein
MNNDELDWFAFRYVAGEMTVGEEERFEERLARDQRAREAVDLAVELKEAIRRVTAESGRVTASRVGFVVWRPAVWGVASAACLVVACTVWLTSARRQHPVAPGGGNPQVGPLNLKDNAVLAWADLRQERHREPFGAEGPWPTIVLEGQLPVIDTGDETALEPGQSVPQWLLSALSAKTERPREAP